VSKAIDKEAGATREVVGVNEDYLRRKPNGMKTAGSTAYNYSQSQMETNADITAPATPAAREWEGWGTALKPACEFWTLARKPLSESTVAKNVLKWGTGGLNIDGTRVPAGEDHAKNCNRSSVKSHWGNSESGNAVEASPLGRFPANLILDEEAAQALDEQSGITKSSARQRNNRPSENTCMSGAIEGESE
jgi:site-specific DNA-methyltransferase (adenine-specific)